MKKLFVLLFASVILIGMDKEKGRAGDGAPIPPPRNSQQLERLDTAASSQQVPKTSSHVSITINMDAVDSTENIEIDDLAHTALQVVCGPNHDCHFALSKVKKGLTSMVTSPRPNEKTEVAKLKQLSAGRGAAVRSPASPSTEGSSSISSSDVPTVQALVMQAMQEAHASQAQQKWIAAALAVGGPIVTALITYFSTKHA